MKPPLKVWLNRLVTGALGESNSNYRAVDAFSGVGVLALTYLSGCVLWRSSLAGLLSWLFLLGSSSWIFGHGPRYGSTDCLLLLFTTLALLLGFVAIRNIAQGKMSLAWAAACGLCSGLAIMTKSASGLIPLIVLAVYALISGEWKNALAQGKTAVLAVFVLAVAVPAPYFVWHSLYSENAFATLILQDVVGRVGSVYWSKPDPLFYLKSFTTSSHLFPPVVSIAGIFYLMSCLTRYPVWRDPDSVGKERKACALFALCWAVLPVFIFSFAGTKAVWYVAPCFPGVAVICGRIGQVLAEKCVELWRGQRRFALGPLCLYLCLLLVFVLIAAGNFRVIRRISAPRKRIPLDRAAHAVTKAARRSGNFEGLVLKRGRAGYSEIPYWNFFRRYSSFVSADDKFFEALSAKKDFIAFPADLLTNVGGGRWPFSSYSIIPPERGREDWYYLFQSASSRARLSGFTPAERVYNISTDAEHVAYGWSAVDPLGPIPYRRIRGQEAGILIEGDSVHRELGAVGEFIVHPTELLVAQVFINALPGPEVGLEKIEGFSRYQFSIPPGLIHDGQNMLSIKIPNPAEVRFAALRLVAGQMGLAVAPSPESP